MGLTINTCQFSVQTLLFSNLVSTSVTFHPEKKRELVMYEYFVWQYLYPKRFGCFVCCSCSVLYLSPYHIVALFDDLSPLAFCISSSSGSMVTVDQRKILLEEGGLGHAAETRE